MLFLFVPGFDGALPAWEQALVSRDHTTTRTPSSTVRPAAHPVAPTRVAGRLSWLFVPRPQRGDVPPPVPGIQEISGDSSSSVPTRTISSC
jgi:hypothetical protein